MIKPSLAFFVWPLVSLVTLIVCLATGYWYFRVTQIECRVVATTTLSACPPELTALLQPLQAQALVGTDFNQHIGNILNQNDSPYELQTINKKLPTKLILIVGQDPFQYQLIDRTSQQRWLVTEHGWLRSTEATPSGQPALATVSQLDLRSKISEDSRHLDPETHQLITRLLQALQLYNVQFQELILYDPVTTVIKLNDTQQLLIENDAVLENLEKYRVLLAHPEQVKTPAPVVEYDVRFKLPVLRTHASIQL